MLTTALKALHLRLDSTWFTILFSITYALSWLTQKDKVHLLQKKKRQSPFFFIIYLNHVTSLALSQDPHGIRSWYNVLLNCILPLWSKWARPCNASVQKTVTQNQWLITIQTHASFHIAFPIFQFFTRMSLKALFQGRIYLRFMLTITTWQYNW